MLNSSRNRILTRNGALLIIVAISGPLAFSQSQLDTQNELLTDGNFSDGMKNWKLEQSGATGDAVVNNAGPHHQAAIRVQVRTLGDQSWRLQLCHPGFGIEKGVKYKLVYWAKSKQDAKITVNCMQNHEPWEHHGAATEVALTPRWTRYEFAFTGPWTDTNARITFTNLGTFSGQAYWFAGCSLKKVLN